MHASCKHPQCGQPQRYLRIYLPRLPPGSYHSIACCKRQMRRVTMREIHGGVVWAELIARLSTSKYYEFADDDSLCKASELRNPHPHSRRTFSHDITLFVL